MWYKNQPKLKRDTGTNQKSKCGIETNPKYKCGIKTNQNKGTEGISYNGSIISNWVIWNGSIISTCY